MSLPPAFVRDYDEMRQRYRWAAEGRSEKIDVPQAKLTVQDLVDFVARWQSQVAIPEIRAALAQLGSMADRIRRKLEKIRLAHLLELIQARFDWEMAELFFKTSQTFIELMKHAPEQLRPELEKVYRDHMGADYVPADEYRQSEASLDDAEASFEKSWREFQTNWPEHQPDEVRKRLLTSTTESLKAWQEELNGDLRRLEKKPAPKKK